MFEDSEFEEDEDEVDTSAAEEEELKTAVQEALSMLQATPKSKEEAQSGLIGKVMTGAIEGALSAQDSKYFYQCVAIIDSSLIPPQSSDKHNPKDFCLPPAREGTEYVQCVAKLDDKYADILLNKPKEGQPHRSDSDKNKENEFRLPPASRGGDYVACVARLEDKLRDIILNKPKEGELYACVAWTELPKKEPDRGAPKHESKTEYFNCVHIIEEKKKLN